MRWSLLLPAIFVSASLCVVFTSFKVSSSLLVNHVDRGAGLVEGRPPLPSSQLATTAEFDRGSSSGGDDGGDNDDVRTGGGGTRGARESRVASSSVVAEAPYLRWEIKEEINMSSDWNFQMPKGCGVNKSTKMKDRKVKRALRRGNETQIERPNAKIIVHYHMQHNAGTAFFMNAWRNVDGCAVRACWQHSKHCMVSYNEDVEANNLRDNFEKHGVEYVSYELMLPPKFPMPFVSAKAREGFFFTTIVRDPFARLVTALGRRPNRLHIEFWMDTQLRSGGDDILKDWMYGAANLNARWLSGAKGEITRDHVNVAKCRLQLFDLVMSDRLMDIATRKVVCPQQGWDDPDTTCEQGAPPKEHTSKKPDPLQSVGPVVVGAWIERLRPSFEIYDYARILSLKHLRRYGVATEDLPPNLSEVPSYVATLHKYTNITLPNDQYANTNGRELSLPPPVNLENEGWYEPPLAFCEGMMRIWTSNSDEVPNVKGIGAIEKIATR